LSDSIFDLFRRLEEVEDDDDDDEDYMRPNIQMEDRDAYFRGWRWKMQIGGLS